MIGRRRHPRTRIVVFIPLRPDDGGAWVPLLGKEFCKTALAAAEECADNVALKFEEIAKHARILRGLCEHPGFEFFTDGVDTDTIRSEACILEELIRAENENVARLLDEPEPTDLIRYGRVTGRVNKDGLLEPRALGASDARSPDDETSEEGENADVKLSADDLLIDVLNAGLSAIEQTTGEAISRQGVENAIALLRALHEVGPRNENGTAAHEAGTEGKASEEDES